MGLGPESWVGVWVRRLVPMVCESGRGGYTADREGDEMVDGGWFYTCLVPFVFLHMPSVCGHGRVWGGGG